MCAKRVSQALPYHRCTQRCTRRGRITSICIRVAIAILLLVAGLKRQPCTALMAGMSRSSSRPLTELSPFTCNESSSQRRSANCRPCPRLQKVEPVSRPKAIAFELGRVGRSRLEEDPLNRVSIFPIAGCSSSHAVWLRLVSTAFCADAADENRGIRPSTSVG